jgi:hypothetical protein
MQSPSEGTHLVYSRSSEEASEARTRIAGDKVRGVM